MAHVNDVAAYILEKRGPMSAMKLQKLVYYAQGWSLVWDEKALFSDPIQAWANGPVTPFLYRQHRGQFKLNGWGSGDASALDTDAAETIDGVLMSYGDLSAHQLSLMTHREPPWLEARKQAGLASGERGTAEITCASMAEYFESLIESEET